jgi:hypothetical protein
MSAVSIGPKATRKMALLLLDDDNGISKQAYGYLSAMLIETGNDDILDAVDLTDNRAYIGEDYAEEELDKLADIASVVVGNEEESGDQPEGEEGT